MTDKGDLPQEWARAVRRFRDRQVPPKELEEMWRVSLAGYCPFCKRGPFKVLSGHVVRIHEMDRNEFRDALGMPTHMKLTDPQTSARYAERMHQMWESGWMPPKTHLPAHYGAPITHGKYSTYSNRGCRCVECRAAWSAYILRLRRGRTAALNGTLRPVGRSGVLPSQAPVKHGDPYTYQNWGCRCDPCTRANSIAKREDYHRRKARA